MPELRHPKGTFDVMPADSGRWEALVVRFAEVVEAAGYRLILTPTFEDIAVFQRVGESTDIVRKEMYDFVDKGGRHIALRPEMTASIMRAYLEHRPTVPWKAWTVGSAFRYERQQAGRYREFRQVDLEAVGSPDPDLDVEVVSLGCEFFAAVGLEPIGLLLNSLGDAKCRPGYRAKLLEYFLDHKSELCDEHQARVEENPLRVLDCKKPECQPVIAGAPHQLDNLCEECAAHFDRVRSGLDALGIPFTISPLLVRGLDYYTRTTFEYVAHGLASAQNAVGGGGRYDGLAKAMGGRETPAIGFALGVDRTLMALEAAGAAKSGSAHLDAFIVDFAGGESARDLSALLRREGFRVDRAFDGRSVKSQMTAAGRSGARFAILIGPDELAKDEVQIKGLRSDDEQVTVPRDRLVDYLRRST